MFIEWATEQPVVAINVRLKNRKAHQQKPWKLRETEKETQRKKERETDPPSLFYKSWCIALEKQNGNATFSFNFLNITKKSSFTQLRQEHVLLIKK